MECEVNVNKFHFYQAPKFSNNYSTSTAEIPLYFRCFSFQKICNCYKLRAQLGFLCFGMAESQPETNTELIFHPECKLWKGKNFRFLICEMILKIQLLQKHVTTIITGQLFKHLARITVG